MEFLHLIKTRIIAYVQIRKQSNRCFYSAITKIDQIPQYMRIIAQFYVYKNTILYLDGIYKDGLGIYFK